MTEKIDYVSIVKESSVTGLTMLKYHLEVEAMTRIQDLILKKEPETLELKLLVPLDDDKYMLEHLMELKNEDEGEFSLIHPQITKVKLKDLAQSEKYHNYYINGVRVIKGKEREFYIGGSDYTQLLLKILEQFECEENRKKYEERVMRKIHFENEDIIITDPCYIIKKSPVKYPNRNDYALEKDFKKALDEYYKEDEKYNDWEDCEYGQNMEHLGLTNYICRDTLYGDWSCTTFDTDTKEPIGEFCADAGEVAVFSLKEVLAYNPDFNYHIEKPWTTTLIKNFTGDVWFERKTETGIYEADSQYTKGNGEPYYRKGEEWNQDYIEVVGQGSINFVGKQTGL